MWLVCARLGPLVPHYNSINSYSNSGSGTAPANSNCIRFNRAERIQNSGQMHNAHELGFAPAGVAISHEMKSVKIKSSIVG